MIFVAANEFLVKIAKIQTINMSRMYADEKVNTMLNFGWKIIDKYNEVDERFPYQYYSTSFFILGHEDPQAQVPVNEIENAIKKRKERDPHGFSDF